MTYDKNRSLQVENEIDLREIIKIFMESKKLIILTTLIFRNPFTKKGLNHSLNSQMVGINS